MFMQNEEIVFYNPPSGTEDSEQFPKRETWRVIIIMFQLLVLE